MNENIKIQYSLLDGTISNDPTYMGMYDELLSVEFSIADYYFKIDLEHGGILSEMEWLYKPKELVEHLSSLKDVTLSELFDGLVDQSSLDIWKWSRFDAEFFRASEIHPYEACLATARGNVNPDHKYIRIKDDRSYETTNTPDYESEAYEILSLHLEEIGYEERYN